MATAIAAGAFALSATAESAQAQVNSTVNGQNHHLGRESSRIMASSAVADYQTLYVNPALGDDSAGGVEAAPLQTVTRALELAAPNTVIVLAPGRYTQSSGEVFPLQLKSGVTIQGMPGSRDHTAIIEGGGNFESPTRSQQNAAIVAADRAGIAQVAISNPNGYGVWVESASPTILETAFVGNRQTGIYVTDGSPRVQGSYFSGNQVAGLIVFGASSANIQSNTFERTGDAIRVVDGATPEIIGNRMTNNEAGLVLIGNSRPVLRDNQIVGNRRDDVVEVATRTSDISFAAAKANNTGSGDLAFQSIAPQPTSQRVSQPTPQLISSPSSSPSIAPQPMAIQPTSRPEIRRSLLATREEPANEPIANEPANEPVNEPVANEPANESVAARLGVTQLVASELIADRVSEGEPSVEADAVSDAPDAGAPGAALAALREGLSSTVSLAPRAVTEENSGPSVIRRDRRSEPNLESISEPTIDSAPPVNVNRLAVPNSSIPVGYGPSTTVFLPPSRGAGAAPPAPLSSRAQALGLYYRVFVDASDYAAQDAVRAVVPDAFRTQFEGRTVMQVGAFPSEDEAQDRERLLEDNDLDARVEYIP